MRVNLEFESILYLGQSCIRVNLVLSIDQHCCPRYIGLEHPSATVSTVFPLSNRIVSRFRIEEAYAGYSFPITLPLFSALKRSDTSILGSRLTSMCVASRLLRLCEFFQSKIGIFQAFV